MSTPTNTQIWAELVKLRTDLSEQGTTMNSLTSDVGDLRRRMDSYETQQKESNELLRDLKGMILFIKNSIRALRWAALIILATFLGQAGVYFYHILTGH